MQKIQWRFLFNPPRNCWIRRSLFQLSHPLICLSAFVIAVLLMKVKWPFFIFALPSHRHECPRAHTLTPILSPSSCQMSPGRSSCWRSCKSQAMFPDTSSSHWRKSFRVSSAQPLERWVAVRETLRNFHLSWWISHTSPPWSCFFFLDCTF